MGPAFSWAALYCAAALAMVSIGARAEGAAPSAERYEAVLDIDRDGRMDRAVLVRHLEGAAADLLIYLGAGSQALDPSHKADFRKDDLAYGHVMQLGTNGKGSLTSTAAAGAATSTRPR
jgi:hypothetical protein